MSELNENKYSKVDYATQAIYVGTNYQKKSQPPRTARSSYSPSNTNPEVVTIEIPVGSKMNFALSDITFDYTISQSYTGTVGATFTSIANAELPLFIDKSELKQKNNSTTLVDLTNVPEYIKTINPRQTPAEEYKKREDNTCFYPCNLEKFVGVIDDSKLTTANYSFNYVDCKLTKLNKDNFTEPQHIIYGDTKTVAVATTAITSTISASSYSVPLRTFKNTVLAIDKTIDIPKELNLTITFGRTREFVAGMVNTYNTLISTTPTVTIANINLNMVCEKDATIRSVGSVIPFPYVLRPIVEERTGKQTHKLSITLHPDNGPKLRKIYASPYLYSFTRTNSSGALDCSSFGYFDNSNFFETSYSVGTNSMTTTNTKCTGYRSYLDSREIQSDVVHMSYANTDLSEDYKYNYRLYHKDDKVDSVFSKNQYYQNWAICQDFTGGLSENVTNISAGMPINKEHTWTCDVEHPHSATQNWFEFVIYKRYLVITPTDIYTTAKEVSL